MYAETEEVRVAAAAFKTKIQVIHPFGKKLYFVRRENVRLLCGTAVRILKPQHLWNVS